MAISVQEMANIILTICVPYVASKLRCAISGDT